MLTATKSLHSDSYSAEKRNNITKLNIFLNTHFRHKVLKTVH